MVAVKVNGAAYETVPGPLTLQVTVPFEIVIVVVAVLLAW